MWGEMGRDGTRSGWQGEARAGSEGLGSHGAISPHATAFLWLPPFTSHFPWPPPLTSHFPCATISQAAPKALRQGRALPWGDGEIWARYGRDMGEIWARYGRDIGFKVHLLLRAVVGQPVGLPSP